MSSLSAFVCKYPSNVDEFYHLEKKNTSEVIAFCSVAFLASPLGQFYHFLIILFSSHFTIVVVVVVVVVAAYDAVV